MPNITWSFWGMLFLIAIRFHDASGQVVPGDDTLLRAILAGWTKAPPSWGTNDACSWHGVTCVNSRVTQLLLSSMGIEGPLSADIGLLTELTTIDMSYNPGLEGTLPPTIVNLSKLTKLLLIGCSFNGILPENLGNLKSITTLDLNTNKFIGSIPTSVGDLADIYWLDMSNNYLDGPIPNTLGNLLKAGHFHFNNNNLSGTIPPEIFNQNMTAMIHVLFESNNLTGTIPETLGLLPTITALRLDRNQLTGTIPSTINNLTTLIELNLGYNKLGGMIPDLSGLQSVSNMDLSNNSFDLSDAPTWLTKMTSLNTLKLQSVNMRGPLSNTLFSSLRQLEKVILRDNKFNGTLDITGSTISEDLNIVNLENNDISNVLPGISEKITLSLAGNPYCITNANSDSQYCLTTEQAKPYSTNLSRCSGVNCNGGGGEGINPATCRCSIPYTGNMFFRAPSFTYLGDTENFQALEKELWTVLDLQANSVYLSDIKFNENDYLIVRVSLFNPDGTKFFNRSQIADISFKLSNQTFKPPDAFGTFYFIPSQYTFPVNSGGSSQLSTAVIAGIVIVCIVVFILILVLGFYAWNQKKRAERAKLQNSPFASWAPVSEGTGAAPQMKGARWFSFSEVDKCTNKFSVSNEIGVGGYGKVYKGVLPSGQVVAIKRSQKGSSQGELEFKTEIELLSRLHHRNLVGFVGFCFDHGEQMLIYEFIPHGTLRENLAGKTKTSLNWKQRLYIALDSARGLSYLHDLADPPIIHRDIKSANILLDDNLTAKVADFGLSKIITDSEKSYVSTQVKGTLGYLDPEYYSTQQLTDKSDVYSFGVVMLELLSSKLPIEKGRYIVREIRQAMRENGNGDFDFTNFIDPIIRNANIISLKRFAELAVQCVEEKAINRPRMNHIVKEIESILQNEGSSPTSSSPTSATSSQTSFAKRPRNVYSDQLPLKDINSDEFVNSAGYRFSDKIEPM